MIRLLVIICFCSLPLSSFSQFSETIRTGRPGQSIGAYTVGKNVLQFQQGVDYFSSDQQGSTLKGYLNNNVIRFGVFENFELSALVDYQQDELTLNSINVESNGLSNLQLGFRIHISDQKGWLPVTGFQARLKLPGLSNDYQVNNVAPVMIFVASWALPKQMILDTNWIIDYNGNDPNPTGKYVVNFGFPIQGNLGAFLGNYGEIYQSTFQTRFEGGFSYLVSDNFAVDLSLGYGDNQNIKDFFISTGVSYRFLNLRN